MKKIVTLIVTLVITLVVALVTTVPTKVYAADNNSGGCSSTAFFGLRPWYEGLDTGANCNIESPADGEIPKFVWTIVLNILTDISVMIGYAAIVVIAWGGYLYMFSRGQPDRAEKGKKTLISAIVGLLISVLASVIMNTIVSILTNRS